MMLRHSISARCTPWGWPVMVTLQGSMFWSIWMDTRNWFCKPLIVSPPLPIRRPTMDLGQVIWR
jgi:hypothetical protein